MRLTSRLPGLIVCGLAVYFALAFGIEGARALIHPVFGFADPATAAIATAAGGLFGFGWFGIKLIAAAIGTAKLATAGFFLLFLCEQAEAAMQGEAATEEAIDIALAGASALTVVLGIGAVLVGASPILRTQGAHLMLISVAAGAAWYRRDVAADVRGSRVAQLPAEQRRMVRLRPN